MKKILAWFLLAAMMIAAPAALADTSDIARFAPYTDVNLDLFAEAGYDCYYDDFEFAAEISSPYIIKSGEEDSFSTLYQIRMDVKVLYSAGSCTLIPRMIFTRSGWDPYFDDRMSQVYIKNGENRYEVDTTGCSRSSSSKSSTATDSSVEPMFLGGTVMLQDLAEYPQTITVKMGNYSDAFILTDADVQALQEFYNLCKQSGIFEQDYLAQYDDYSIRTLFNENTIEAQEDSAEELAEPAPEEEDAA